MNKLIENWPNFNEFKCSSLDFSDSAKEKSHCVIEFSAVALKSYATRIQRNLLPMEIPVEFCGSSILGAERHCERVKKNRQPLKIVIESRHELEKKNSQIYLSSP